MPVRLALLLIALLAGAPAALAHSYSFDDFKVGHLWSPVPEEGEDSLVVYGPLIASGDGAITVTGVTSPDAAQARFRKVEDGVESWPESLVLEPGRPLGLAAWREHIWLGGLTRPLHDGDAVTLELTLSDGRHLEVESMVENAPGD